MVLLTIRVYIHRVRRSVTLMSQPTRVFFCSFSYPIYQLNSRSLADIANAQLKLQFGFSNRRGALLVMHQHQATRVPDNLLDELTKIDYLKEKVLVTRVINCPGYVRYLSSKRTQACLILS